MTLFTECRASQALLKAMEQLSQLRQDKVSSSDELKACCARIANNAIYGFEKNTVRLPVDASLIMTYRSGLIEALRQHADGVEMHHALQRQALQQQVSMDMECTLCAVQPCLLNMRAAYDFRYCSGVE